MADNPPAARPPSLPVAREIAREMLDRYRVINIRDEHAVIEAYTALHIALAQVLGALDHKERS